MSVFNYFCLNLRTYLIFILFFYLFSFNLIQCFNLETRLPITKFGQNGSYFGYSVASHQVKGESSGQVEKSWILVGAPLGQNLQPGTNRSGALWKCPLSSDPNDCKQVITDGKRTIDAQDLNNPLPDEIKDGQWLGVSLSSQGPGGKVVVCAHRYIRNGTDHQWGHGLCYTLTQRLDVDASWEPCKGREGPRSNNFKDFTFEYCQAGTSSFFVEDDCVLIGTPGTFVWKGNIFVISASDDPLKRDTHYHHATFDDYLPLQVDKYSYLGMAVTAGNFLDQTKISYAAGAPRGNGTGQVLFFTKSFKKGQKQLGLMELELTIDGEQFASNFGYQLTTADVNGDGEPDLIVAAPFYYDNHAGGAVYIYLNADHCLNCLEPIKITGKPDSRFGLALANLGDLNNDGYQDIAVGAPYQGNGAVYIYLGSQNGIITEPSQIIESESVSTPRVLSTFGYSLSPGMDLDQNGYNDLLIGAYESEAAILLRGRPIIHLETSAGPEYNLKNIDPTKNGCPQDPKSENTCFTFSACCKIGSLLNSSKKQQNGKVRLNLKVRLEAETFNRKKKFSRIYFIGTDPNNIKLKNYKSNIDERIFEVRNGDSSDHCESFTAYVKENVKDIQSPIQMKLTYNLIQKEPKKIKLGEPLQHVDEFPILNKQQADIVFQATFHKDCGDDDICDSQLHIEAFLQLKGVNGSYYELMLGQHQEVLLNITVHNIKEAAYEAHLYISHHINLGYIGLLKTETKQAICNPYNKTMVICALGNPLKNGAGHSLKLRFDPHALGEEPELDFTLFANTTSREFEKEDPVVLKAIIVRKAELSLRGTARPEQVFYGGEVKPVHSIEYLDEVGTRIVHTYQVFNAGPWRVSHMEIHIDWPSYVEGNPEKQLLYIEAVPEVEALGGGSCTANPSDINPYNLHHRPGFLEMPIDRSPNNEYNSNFTFNNRVKRDWSDFKDINFGPEIYTDEKDGRKRQVVNMDCLQGSATCFKIICSVYNLQPTHEATIFIRARLWNSTLVQNYGHIDIVKIASRAKIHIPPSLFLNQDIKDDIAQVETVAIRDMVQQSSSTWWIILAILLGILLLILLTWCLWRFGFFKRRRYDPTLSGNIEKHTDDDFSDDDY